MAKRDTYYFVALFFLLTGIGHLTTADQPHHLLVFLLLIVAFISIFAAFEPKETKNLYVVKKS